MPQPQPSLHRTAYAMTTAPVTGSSATLARHLVRTADRRAWLWRLGAGYLVKGTACVLRCWWTVWIFLETLGAGCVQLAMTQAWNGLVSPSISGRTAEENQPSEATLPWFLSWWCSNPPASELCRSWKVFLKVTALVFWADPSTEGVENLSRFCIYGRKFQ